MPDSEGISELEWMTLSEPEPTTVTFEGARLAQFDAGENQEWFCEILEVSFGGCYRHGSLGNPDAHAMVLELAKLLWHSDCPDVVLLNLSRLSYEWGDRILRLFEVIQRFDCEYPLGVVVLGGPSSEPALSSLLGLTVHTDAAAAYEDAKAQAVRRSMDIG